MSQNPNTRFSMLEVRSNPMQKSVVPTYTTAAAITYSAADIESGLIIRDTNGLARADLVPTAATLNTYFRNPEANMSMRFIIRNSSGAANAITVTTNTGITLSGTMSIAQLNSKEFKLVFTSNTAVTIYSLGTIVF